MRSLADLDGAALLRAVIDDPDDDLRRLVYADWLDEQGQGGRAQIIRVQIDIARLGDDDEPAAELDALRALEDRLLALDRLRWLCPAAAAVECAGAEAGCSWCRGFVSEVQCPLAAWTKHGPALAAAHPLEEVRLTDRQPYRYDVGKRQWRARQAGFHDVCATLPRDLFDLIDGQDEGGAVPYLYRSYRTSRAAEAALSRALIAWARQRPPAEASLP